MNPDNWEGHTSGMHDWGQEDPPGAEENVRGARYGITGIHIFGGGFLNSLRQVPEGIGVGPRSRGLGLWHDLFADEGSTGSETGSGEETVAQSPPASTGGGVIRSENYFQGMTCERYRGREMSTRQRYTGENLKRLKAAGLIVAPDYTSDVPGKVGYAERFLAYYQEELDKPKPDYVLAGIYLGLISGKKLTNKYLTRVNRALCVTMSDKQRKTAITAASEQTEKLEKEKK